MWQRRLNWQNVLLSQFLVLEYFIIPRPIEVYYDVPLSKLFDNIMVLKLTSLSILDIFYFISSK